MTKTEQRIRAERIEACRQAAVRAAYGEPYSCPEPAEPHPAEVLYLQACEAFPRSQCRGWDLVDAADVLAAGIIPHDRHGS